MTKHLLQINDHQCLGNHAHIVSIIFHLANMSVNNEENQLLMMRKREEKCCCEDQVERLWNETLEDDVSGKTVAFLLGKQKGTNGIKCGIVCWSSTCF